MGLFLVTFFLIYGGMHLYAFSKARAALGFGTAVGFAVAVFMLIMVAAPFIIRYTERLGLESLARVFAWIGYLWLGIIFLFTSFAFAMDLGRLLLWLGSILLNKELPAMLSSPGPVFFLPLAAALIASAYGFVEAGNIKAEHITIETEKLPADVRKLTIAQVSDVHLGLIVRKRQLARIAALIAEAAPDILVSTGDLVDGQVCEMDGLSDLLRGLPARYGKFAVTGNHEFYAGLDNAICFTEKAGFALLRGQAVAAGPITIAGVDDPTAGTFHFDGDFSGLKTLRDLPRDRFVLFLKHRPLIQEKTLGLFDLQLSGHVHKGQIFPFTILTWLYYPIEAGYADLPKGSRLYVSRGSGTWGPPIRLMSSPEVTIITLLNSRFRERRS